LIFHDNDRYMESTVTTKNMVSIPQALSRHFGIEPGWKLDWKPGDNPDEIIVKVIPDRAERGRRLMGRGACLKAGQDAVAALVADREAELAAEHAAEYKTGHDNEHGAES
jgi:bifunctional DNA-binding transcriptional regulator/antitoxin component of YhaV-PrlF toxin-antitoxin module